MIGWIVRILFIFAGFIASWFVAEDELRFSVVQMVIAVLLFTLLVMLIAFWSELKKCFRRFRKK